MPGEKIQWNKHKVIKKRAIRNLSDPREREQAKKATWSTFKQESPVVLYLPIL